MARRFMQQGLGYVLNDHALAVSIAVDRLSRTRGELHGEISVSCGLPGIRAVDGHVHQARFNLSGSTARTTLARILQHRAEAPGLDWPDLLEDFCRRVLAAEREGDPVTKVGTDPIDLTAAQFRVEPILPINQVTILYGEGGTGKSTLACMLAVSVETGAAIVAGWKPRKAPVLYLDWEGGRTSLNRRVRGVAMGANIPHAVAIDYMDCRRRGPLAGFAEDVARLVDREGYGAVVVDSIGMASGTSSEGGDANESAIRLFSAFGYLGTTVLGVDHVSKATADEPGKPARPYGSIYKSNLARATYELRRTKTPDGDSMLALFNTKANDADTLPPVSLRVQHGDDGSIAYERQEQMPTILTRSLSRAQRIAAELRFGHMTAEEIADRLEDDQHKVRTELNRHKLMFNRLPSGSWELLGQASSHAS